MKRLSILLVLALLLGALPVALSESAEGLGIVETAYGQVSGVFENGLSYYKGVPYAAPPVGELRWAAPEDPAAWEGVRACDAYAPMAMQILSTNDWWGPEFYYDWFDVAPPMSEDCLYLNVVTPATDSEGGYPVYVWFHGGASMHGYSWEPEFEPSELVKKGVIVVSVGYRLGLFGYMATADLSAQSATGTSGNYRYYVGGAAGAELNDYTDAVVVADPASVNYLVDPGEEGGEQLLTAVYVPRDEEKQAKTIARYEEAPRNGDNGTVAYETVTLDNGITTSYAIYLPHEYDAQRAEAYPILVLFHGGGGYYGSWFANGLVNILDNLIAEGRMEPTIVVTPNGSDFPHETFAP